MSEEWTKFVYDTATNWKGGQVVRKGKEEKEREAC